VPFTFVWTSDTQTMVVARDMRPAYLALCDWIAAEAETRNFVLFLHTGDMVDDGDSYGQWQAFLQGVDAFRDRIPFFWALGNHDEGQSFGMRWKKYLEPDVPPEQICEDGEAWYRIFEQGNTRLMLLSVGYRFSHTERVLNWAREACSAHADLPVLLITHEYLTAQGGLSNRAALMESRLVAACPNIRLVLCGHARGISRAAFSYDDDGDGVSDRTVNVLMYDTQTDRTRFGYLCLLTYDPVQNALSCTSYSPYLDDEIYDDEAPEKERFTLQDVF
jgi:3',5'-cyclic AMP phosphodiesterase CpdA